MTFWEWLWDWAVTVIPIHCDCHPNSGLLFWLISWPMSLLPVMCMLMAPRLDHYCTCRCSNTYLYLTWWRHQMETFSMLLAICAGNSLVTGEFPAQRPVMGSFDVFFDLRLNKWLSKQSWGWWFETPSCPLWRHSNDSARASAGTVITVRPFCWRNTVLSLAGHIHRMNPGGRLNIKMSSYQFRDPHVKDTKVSWRSYL